MERNRLRSKAGTAGGKPAPKSSYELLVLGSRAHTAMPRLRAEAERIYPEGNRVGGYVFTWLDEVEIYIMDSTYKFQEESDKDADSSIVGELSTNEMIRRRNIQDEVATEALRKRDRLDERIALRQNKSNIITFPGKVQESTVS